MKNIKKGDYVKMLEVSSDRNYLEKGKIYQVSSAVVCSATCSSCSNVYNIYVRFLEKGALEKGTSSVGATCCCRYKLITDKKIVKILNEVAFCQGGNLT